ncbi:response regulator [Gemmata sp. G18]|uniref:Response regulator n=1 Tax=Gemmata palustris TaxID=2822762 RepID=A0ABS5BSL9_9BACT|nr:response regulator [Gemmata palustris]MBP3956693.1 response regulator [Gemmata palustris]
MEDSICPLVLVVDDEPSVREVFGVMLTHLGYTPLLASNGEEGVDVLRTRAGRVAVALLDVQMPGMDGPATMDALHTLEPDLPCVFVSGETGLYTSAALIARGGFSVLAKPVFLKELRRVFALVTNEADFMGAHKPFFSAD